MSFAVSPSVPETDKYQRVVTSLKNLKRSNIALEQDCERLKTELSALNDQRSQLDGQLKRLRTQEKAQKTTEAANYEMKMKIEDLNADHEKNMEKLVSLKQIFEQTAVQLCNERKKRQRIEARTAKIVENIEGLTKVAQSLQAKPEQVKQNELLMKKLQDKKLKWKESKQKLQEMLDGLRQKRDRCLEDAQNYQVQIDDRTGLIEQLEARVERRNKSIADLEASIQEQSDRYQAQLDELDRQTKEVEELSAKQEKMKENLKQSIIIFNNSKKKYEKERDKLSNTKAYMRQFQESFAEKLRTMKEDAEQETQAKVEELRKVEQEKDEELKRLQGELQAAQAQFDEESAKLKTLEAEREKEKKRFSQAKENLETKFQTMQKIVSALTQTSLTDF